MEDPKNSTPLLLTSKTGPGASGVFQSRHGQVAEMATLWTVKLFSSLSSPMSLFSASSSRKVNPEKPKLSIPQGFLYLLFKKRKKVKWNKEPSGECEKRISLFRLWLKKTICMREWILRIQRVFPHLVGKKCGTRNNRNCNFQACRGFWCLSDRELHRWNCAVAKSVRWTFQKNESAQSFNR